MLDSINMTILIIEDEKKLVDILTEALKGEKYAVEHAFDGAEGLQKAQKGGYSLIILDLMLPKMSGLEICKQLRENSIHTPIIMLTARGTVEDRANGLDIGADDYLVKPFSMQELFARIRAVLRRRKTSDSPIVKIDDLVLDSKKHEVTRAGKVISLTTKEYRILTTLMARPGEAITRRELLDDVWGTDFEESNHDLNVHIRYLREKIDDKSKKPLIRTVRGVGYSLTV